MDGLIWIYVQVPLVSFILNIIPAFAPPTWIILTLYKILHPDFNIFLLAFLGMIGSVAGRFVMYYYSKFFRKYLPKRDRNHLDYLRKLGKGRNFELFLLTFLYSLSPLPSNFLFITSGITSLEIRPLVFGFGLGRFTSYSLITYGVFRTSLLLKEFGMGNVTLIMDLLGILASILVMFIDWKKVYKKFEAKR